MELEHYEKVEGVPLTFRGKVNRLATMVRGNLGAALQGFVARRRCWSPSTSMPPNLVSAGRIVSFDAAGGWNIEEEGYQAVGSGSLPSPSRRSRSSTRRSPMPTRRCKAAIEALYDAADDDSATGGPDLVRGIYPTAVLIGGRGRRGGDRGADRRSWPARSSSAPDTVTDGNGADELPVLHLARAGDA